LSFLTKNKLKFISEDFTVLNIGLLTICVSPLQMSIFTKTKKMFSTGQLIFALLFVIVFTTIIIFSYRKDKVEQPNYFKGSSKVLVAIAVVVILLFTIKLLTVK